MKQGKFGNHKPPHYSRARNYKTPVLAIIYFAAFALVLTFQPVASANSEFLERGYANAQGMADLNPSPVSKAGAPNHNVVSQAPAQILFSDDFDGTSLDSSKWHTCFWWATDQCTIESTNEMELYTRENVLVDSGILRLRAQKKSAVWDFNGKTFNYTSGMVMTGGRKYLTDPGFTFTYGYAEARVKIPAGQGIWPAFWMLPASYNSEPEIDIMEILGHQPDVVHFHIHNGVHPGQSWTGEDFSQGWHTFAVDWQPDAIVWYVDGVERWRYTGSAVPAEPSYLLLNLAVGGDWPGAPDATTVFPAYYDVDYVRVWDRKPDTVITPPAADPISLPGRIEAEDYIDGGQGLGYFDTTAGNTGGLYRNDDVDIQLTGDVDGNYNVGWIEAGEWLAFDVDVTQSGYYDITARVASGDTGAKALHLEVDGVDVTGPITFDNTGGWQTWQDVVLPRVELPAGRSTLHVVMDTTQFNLNYIDISRSAEPVNSPPQVDAGIDVNATRAGSVSISLSGIATDDGLPSGALATSWTATGPAPGPPPPWGVEKVLCRFIWMTSKPMSPGLTLPRIALRLAPS